MNQVNGYDQDPMHIHDNKPPFLFWNQYYPNFYVKKLLKIVNNQQFEKSNTIGISSGASAPEVLVDQLLDQIKEIRNIEVEEVEIVKENVEFKLPKELRVN